MREALHGFEEGVRFGGERITDLRYADDTTLICSSRNELINLRRVKGASEKKGLHQEDTDGQVIGEVSEFGYLGSLIYTKSDSTIEIKRRLAIPRTTTQNMLNIWKSRGLSIDLMLRFLYRATVFSIFQG